MAQAHDWIARNRATYPDAVAVWREKTGVAKVIIRMGGGAKNQVLQSFEAPQDYGSAQAGPQPPPLPPAQPAKLNAEDELRIMKLQLDDTRTICAMSCPPRLDTSLRALTVPLDAEKPEIAQLQLSTEFEAHEFIAVPIGREQSMDCLLYTSPSPRDQRGSRMPSSA